MENKNKLYFITGNKTKFEEAKEILGDFELEQFDVDLPEIQEIDSRAVVKAKLEAALEHHAGPFIVDDVSVRCEALNGLPGPLIRWFLKSFSLEELHSILERLGNTRTEVSLLIGYAKNRDDVHFFEGVVRGKIVAPRGEYFGWDPIFQPDGSDKTYAEMGREEKNKLSHRRLALDKLKEFLENK
jgi:non-canonical purine NTP pyrophosphatase (RdgB/HAM1 family)